MKKILVCLVLLTSMFASAYAPYLQDSNIKMRYALVRREAYNALLMSQDALLTDNASGVKTALAQLTKIRPKVAEVIRASKSMKPIDVVQFNRDILDLEEYIEKMDKIKQELLTTQATAHDKSQKFTQALLQSTE